MPSSPASVPPAPVPNSPAGVPGHPAAGIPAASPVPAAAAAARPAGWLRRKLVQPLLEVLKSGLSPRKLALTVGLGVAFGLAPTFGVTTLVSSAVALRLRLNVAAMQVVCHLFSPLQLILVVPFLRLGATVLGYGHEVQNLRLAKLQKWIAADGWGVLRVLWRAELGALLVWAAVSAPVVAALYVSLQPVFKKVIVRQRAATLAGLRAARVAGSQGAW